jgi:hypothetical protein
MAGLPEELFLALQEPPALALPNNNKDHSARGSVADAERGGPHCFQGFFPPRARCAHGRGGGHHMRARDRACARESDAVVLLPFPVVINFLFVYPW